MAARTAVKGFGALALTVPLAFAAPARSPAQIACERAEFEAVVADAAKALKELNQKNRPAFQGRLRELKDKRGWSHDQFLKDGAAFVQDSVISEYDERSTATLERIERIGAEGAASPTPSCKALGDVRGLMQDLVRVQTEKWGYMFGKIERELAR